MRELVFLVEGVPGYGYTAHALGASIHTEGSTREDLIRAIRDAVRCHFGPAHHGPECIRLVYGPSEVFYVDPSQERYGSIPLPPRGLPFEDFEDRVRLPEHGFSTSLYSFPYPTAPAKPSEPLGYVTNMCYDTGDPGKRCYTPPVTEDYDDDDEPDE